MKKYKEKICKNCQIKFDPPGSRSKYCKDCSNENRKEYNKNYLKIYNTENKEILKNKRKPRSKIYYQENKEKYKTYYEENKEKIKSYKKDLRHRNKDKIKQQKQNYYNINKEKIREKAKIKYLQNKTIISEQQKVYRFKNKSKIKLANNIYYKNNISKIRITREKYKKNRRKNDMHYNLHSNISKRIAEMLKLQNCSKNNKSCSKYLPFTKDELYNHIEQQFNYPGNEWMNWNNYGVYRISEWDDNNILTWKWSLDHIIPQSDLPYNSMEDYNFKKCWSLDNLRPYSAKQNQIDGLTKVRHTKKEEK